MVHLVMSSLVNRQFGWLKILEFAGSHPKEGRLWKAGCLCGNYKIVSTGNLMRKGKALRSCGSCGLPEKFPKEYAAWSSAKQRCLNPNTKGYENYGGRGISMCLEWQLDFMKFLMYIGLAPSTEYSLDRIENNGNYEPGNVKWSIRMEQIMNRSCTLPISKAIYKATLEGKDPF